jgi:hypothetical protein
MKKSFMAIVSLAAFSGLGSAYAQVETEGVRDIFEHMYVEPGQFTVNSDADTEVVDFDQPRDVRFCLDVSEHRTPLHIKYEKKTKVLRPGNCMTVEAKEIAISAAGDLEAGWNLTGTYDISRD